MNETQTKDSYTSQWREYQKLSTRYWLVFVTFMPAMALIGMPLAGLLGSDYIIYVVAIAWMIALVVFGSRYVFWKCPRCHQPFFRTWWSYNLFARRCVHCKLPKYAEFSTDA